MDGTATDSGLFEPLLAPNYPVSHTDQGAYILVTAVILVSVSGLAVSVKLEATISTYKKIRSNDVALIASLVGTSERVHC